MILAGRRGGKTYCMTERAIRRIGNSPKMAKIFFVGPTHGHAEELFWDHLAMRFNQLGWKYRPRLSKKHYELADKRKVYVIGAERFDLMRGHGIWHVAFDEIAYFREDLSKIWRAVRPALSDFKGTSDWGSTPDGKGSQAYEFYNHYKGKLEWSYHHWVTLDNPYMDPGEIEEAKRDLDEVSFKQEYEASWETFSMLAYYNYQESVHRKQQAPINPAVPVHMAFDFNVNPTTLLLSQYQDQTMRYVKEYSFNDSSTERTIKSFCEDNQHLKDSVLFKVRGDATGDNRKSNTGKTDYQYVRDVLGYYGFNYKYEVRASNPAIVDRVKIVNGWLKPIAGRHRVELDPSCIELHKDFDGQKSDGRIPSPEGNRGHKADAAGYDIYWQYCVDNRKPSGVIQL